MSKKQFVKRAAMTAALTMIFVIVGSLTYAYVIPPLLAADIPGIMMFQA